MANRRIATHLNGRVSVSKCYSSSPILISQKNLFDVRILPNITLALTTTAFNSVALGVFSKSMLRTNGALIRVLSLDQLYLGDINRCYNSEHF